MNSTTLGRKVTFKVLGNILKSKLPQNASSVLHHLVVFATLNYNHIAEVSEPPMLFTEASLQFFSGDKVGFL